MTVKKHTKMRILLVLACLMVSSLIAIRAAGTPADAEVAIVVNLNNPVNNLTLADLRKIYFGDRQYWKGNLPVVLLMRSPGSHEREVVLRVVFEMTEERYTKYWVAKVMRAEVSDPPASLYSFGILQEGVRGNPGAIGCVNVNDVRPGVKVLRIDGLLPGESGYPLR
jgi:ABC-type phosphate transport system substrate-binding protein